MPNSWYNILDMELKPLSQNDILADLRTSLLPRAVRCYGQVGSTNDLARALLTEIPESALPLLVTADEQTAGRGRLGRIWLAPPGSALLFSLAFRPVWLAPERARALVYIAGVALCEAVYDVCGITAGLKWPNDLLVAADAIRSGPASEQPALSRYAKAAGVLLEVSAAHEALEWAILGIGVNVSSAPPPELTRYPAIHLETASGRAIDRLALLRALLRRIDSWYGRLMANDDQALFAAWRSRLLGLGQPAELSMPEGLLRGVAEDVDADGSLRLRDAAGTLHTVTTGDVGLVGGA